jgi:hypothetical protein
VFFLIVDPNEYKYIMDIKYLTGFYFDELVAFNNQSYPKKTNSTKLLKFWFDKSKDEIENSIILVNNGRIFGQLLTSRNMFFYKGKSTSCKWFFNYIVDEKYRKSGYGIDLLIKATSNDNLLFGAGSAPLALKIELKMGFILIGELKKFIAISFFPSIISSFFRNNISENTFPERISKNGVTFNKVDVSYFFNHSVPFNENLLEFGRDNNYLKWRFFSGLHDYVVYKSANNNNYFAVRTIIRKSITCLVLVDYRCNLANDDEFEEILHTVKSISKKLKIGVIITASSLKCVDNILEKRKFKSIGRHRPLIAYRSFKDEDKRINNRELVLVTLADSDGEVSW